jgi:hypothetical protein
VLRKFEYDESETVDFFHNRHGSSH